jgi:beta-lactamase regulating signal transducer with metallopeptidase domain
MSMHLIAIAGFFSLAQAAGQQLSAAFVRFAHAVAPVAVAALWQGAAVAAGLALCLRLAPRLSAAHRFSVWAGGFMALLGLQTLPLLVHPAAASGVGIVSSAASQPWLQRPILELDARWTLAIAALWLALAFARAVDLALHTLRLRTLWKNASPVDGVYAAGAGGRRRVAVCTTGELDRPGVIGFFAPRILIPDWLYARLTPGELEQVILHECEHLRRRDDWTNLLQKLSLVLFPLNPTLAWMEHRLCREREMACDEGVVRVTRAPRAYAACLASMAERRLEKDLARRTAAALSLGAFERRSELAGRVHSILWRKNVLSPLGSRALVGVVGCGLLLGAAELAQSPQVVAFVSAPVPETETAEAQTAPLPQAPNSPEHLVALDGHSAQALHAIDALAIMPVAPQRRMRNSAAIPGSVAGGSADREATPVSVAPRQQLPKADANGSAIQRDQVQVDALPQQWIVLTTWQQVETPAAGSDTIADFSANADSDTAAPAQPDKVGTRQFTVTQLILRVYPASALSAPGGKAQAAGGSSAKPNTGSNSVLHRQAVLPLDGGWLVIQL